MSRKMDKSQNRYRDRFAKLYNDHQLKDQKRTQEHCQSRIEQTSKELDECTFTPQINHGKMNISYICDEGEIDVHRRN